MDICGDGELYGARTNGYCDDGNFEDEDGCNSECQVEVGYDCTGGDEFGSDT